VTTHEEDQKMIDEGGQQEEKLTHWIMPDHIFRTHVENMEYGEYFKDKDIK